MTQNDDLDLLEIRHDEDKSEAYLEPHQASIRELFPRNS